MSARLLFSLVSAFSIFTFAGAAEARLGSGQGGSSYAPAGAGTCAMCSCNSVNGTCDQTTCKIKCNDGFADCDGVVGTGCECGSADGCHAAVCNGMTCGANTVLPDNTACTTMQPGCNPAAGVCNNGFCGCPGAPTPDLSGTTGDTPDLGHHGGGGNGQGGCSVTATGTAPLGAWTLLALIGLALVLRRRSA